MSLQTCMALFLLWNTKGELLEKVHAALFNSMKVDETEHCKNKNRQNKSLRNRLKFK